LKVTLNKNNKDIFTKISVASGLDYQDLKILSALTEDPRASYADLSEKIGLSRDVIKYRINKLIEKGVIEGFQLTINPLKIGLNSLKILNISISNYEKSFLKEFSEHLNSSPYTVDFKQTMGNFDFSVTVISENDSNLSSIINEIKSKFKSSIKDIQIINVIENE